MFKQSVLLISLATCSLINAMEYDDEQPLVTIGNLTDDDQPLITFNSTSDYKQKLPEVALSSQNFALLGHILCDLGARYKGSYPAQLTDACTAMILSTRGTKVSCKKTIPKKPIKAFTINPFIGLANHSLMPLFSLTDEGRMLVSNPGDLGQVLVRAHECFEREWLFKRDTLSVCTVLANRTMRDFFLVAIKKDAAQHQTARVMYLNKDEKNEIIPIAHAEPKALHGQGYSQ